MASNILLPRFALKSPTSSKSSKKKGSNAIQKNGTNGFSNILRLKKKRTKNRAQSVHHEFHMNITFMTNREETVRRESVDPSLSASILIIASLEETHCFREMAR